jgi:hypothetical protein
MYRQCRLPSRTESRVVDLENDFYYAKLAAQTPPEPESIAVFDPNKTCTVGKPFENSARKVEDLPSFRIVTRRTSRSQPVEVEASPFATSRTQRPLLHAREAEQSSFSISLLVANLFRQSRHFPRFLETYGNALRFQRGLKMWLHLHTGSDRRRHKHLVLAWIEIWSAASMAMLE